LSYVEIRATTFSWLAKVLIRYMDLNFGPNINTNILWPFSFNCRVKKKWKGSKHLTFFVSCDGQILPTLVNKNFQVYKTTMNNHRCKVLVQVIVYKNDEVQDISKESMALILVRNTINDNEDKNLIIVSQSLIFDY